MVKSNKAVLAVDIDGTKYITGLVGLDGEVFAKQRFYWHGRTKDEVIMQLKNAMRATLEGCGLDIVAIGMTIPGLVDPDTGILISSSGCMGLHDVPMVSIMEKRFNLPVYIDNARRACTMAEKRFGVCTDCENFLYMTGNNGIEGGLFLNGEVYYGGHGNAGEIGQCVTEEGKDENKDNQHSLMACATDDDIVRIWLEEGGAETVEGEPASSAVIMRLAEAGNETALRAFMREGYYLGKAIALACVLLDPEKVVIGGGLSMAFKFIYPMLEKTLKEQTYYRDTLPFTVEPSTLGYDGTFFGAAALAISRTKSVHN